MPYYCTVPRCTSLAGKTVNVSFHQFPRDRDLADQWNRILKRGKPYTKYSKVCSLHFTANDYTFTSVGKNKGQWRTLRKDAVPSQNLPEHSPPPDRSRPSNADDNISDQELHKQLAQAIYMQTIIAVHAASMAAAKSTPVNTEQRDSDNSDQRNSQDTNRSDSPRPSQNTPLDQENASTEHDKRDTTHRCDQCSKCFKDPDVFLLHKRWHYTQSNTHESQEIINKMLQLSSEFDSRFLTNPLGLDPLNMEHQILLAMRMNMESYIKNLTTFSDSGEKTESNGIQSNE